MSTPLNGLSARPVIIVDSEGNRLGAPDGGTIGTPGPWGRNRLVTTLPLADGPRRIRPDILILQDPQGAYVGTPGLIVSRLVQATTTLDTRRL
jgi:hypothetical protein